MATSLRHKPVCTACRARKKKCDSERPACSSCRKRRVQCTYGPNPASIASGMLWDQVQGMPTDHPFALDSPDTNFPSLLDTVPLFSLGSVELAPPAQSLNPWDTGQFDLLSSTSSSLALLSDTTGSSLDLSDPGFDSILSLTKVLDLVDLFFDRVQCFLPLFHRRILTHSITTGDLRQRSPLLLYSLMALTARAHPDLDIRAAQGRWQSKAKDLFETTSHVPDHPLETLQAAVCIATQALLASDHSTALFVVGKAWRQAVAIGLHQFDSPSRMVLPGVTLSCSGDWRVGEMCRRMVWCLYILDREMCFPAGLAFAIDDRQLRLKLPMVEDVFQVSENAPNDAETIQYSSNMNKLLSSFRTQARQKPRNPVHYVLLAYTLLGRVIEHLFSPEYDQGDSELHSECLDLQNDISRVRLMMPRSVTDLAAASHADFKHVVWLRIMMNVNNVFLYHRPSRTDCDTENLSSEGWQNSLAAARDTAQLVREASRVSTDLLMNPWVAAPIFTCARILAIEYLSSSSPNSGESGYGKTAMRADLEVMLLIFDRLDEAFGGVMHKFRIGLLYHLHQGQASVQDVKANGSRGLLLSCGKWPTVKDIEGAEGIPD
ncbi:hypothetical protein OQA88_5612 [Cercophora sp. LCS_1]